MPGSLSSRFHRLCGISSALLFLAPLVLSQDEEFEATLSTPVVIDNKTGDILDVSYKHLTLTTNA